MGNMSTLKPNESLRDHANRSLEQLAEVVNLTSILETREPNRTRFSVKVDLCKAEFERIIQHARESIESLNDLCDELDDDLYQGNCEFQDQVEYLEDQIKFWKNIAKIYAKNGYIDTDITHIYPKTTQSSNRLEKCYKDLEQQLATIKGERDLAKKLAKKLMDDKRVLKSSLTSSELELKALREVLNKKYDEIESLTQQLIDSSPNNPQNFCGNCLHYAQIGKDDHEFEGICTQHYIKRVDPDDASCPHFESNQVDRDKPDHPCCEACNRDDCDDCTLCPF